VKKLPRPPPIQDVDVRHLQLEQLTINGSAPADAAAEYGRLELLQWAREHHCPWDERTCYGAARTPGRTAVGAGAALPLGRGDVSRRR
jgi:hypothetical protein